MKREIRVALAGNPNVGKTAIMNTLAGTHASIGNWPGVTVEKKEGEYSFRGFDIKIIDLPGIYSLTSYTIEERVAREFLIKEDYDVVVDVIDISLLARNLYLTLELLDMGVKPIIALNKIDEFEKFGYSIDSKQLENITGLPVVKISAVKKTGLNELSEKIVEVATGDVEIKGFIPRYSREIENAIDEIVLLLKEEDLPYSKRWFAIKLLENDPQIVEEVRERQLWDKLSGRLNLISEELSEKYGCDLPTVIARERFRVASNIAKSVVKTFAELPQYTFSDRIDRVITNPLTGIPIFFLIMWSVFKATFDLSAPFSDVIDSFFGEFLPAFVNSNLGFLPRFAISLINDGVLAGIGSVMVFFPILLVLYLLISTLEDTGYMARAAALWDNFMRVFGLSGASVIPMILGFGCNVPAVYATRAMRSPRQRLITMLIIPWMSCSARLPVYAVFVAAFFKDKKSLIILSLYILGIVLALLFSVILSRFVFKSEEHEFFIELPPYKLPSWNVIFNQTWIEVREFLYKAGTVIFAISMLIWVLASFPYGVDYAGEASLIGHFGKWISPIFSPLGFSDWKPVVALIFGALAKEVVVGTLGTLYGGEQSLISSLQAVFTPASALAFLVFTLLYVPCVATIAAIKQESGSWKWVLFVIAVEILVAWILSFSVYHIANLLILA